jgi:hypothetical protein
MTHSTSTRFAGLAAALLASLVFASVANARPAELSSNLSQKSDATQVTISVPDRVDKLGVITAGPIAVPDRVDQLGTVNGPGSVAVATVPSSSSGSLTWSDLPVFAAAIFAIALLATIGSLMMRKRSGTALAS